MSIVGLGADGVPSLTEAARAAVLEAELVVGGGRQLELIEPLIKGQRMAWPSPFAAGIDAVVARRGKSTCVLASGDPFFYGVGASLAKHVSADEWQCFPAPSSLSLAAARLGWPLQDVDVISLHGRHLSSVIRHLQPGRQLFALTWDERTPRELSQLLCARGFGDSRIHVLEELGAPEERVRSCLLRDFDLRDVATLNLVALELVAAPDALVIPCRGSLPDSMFENDGQLTKQDIRALTLTALAPRAGELLWDVGAGAGSIAIEWLLSHTANRAIAIECEAERCARIRRNAQHLGAPTLQIVEAEAPHGLSSLAAPDAVFVGGGGGDARVFEACFQALRVGGRLVMNAVALETEALLFTLYKQHGGQLRRFSVESAAALGSMTSFRAALPVTQWRLVKS